MKYHKSVLKKFFILQSILFLTRAIPESLLKNSSFPKKNILTPEKKYGDDFVAEMGAEAIQKLLHEYDPERYDVYKNRLINSGKISLGGKKAECTHSPLTCECDECKTFAELDTEWRNNLEVVSDDLKKKNLKVFQPVRRKSSF